MVQEARSQLTHIAEPLRHLAVTKGRPLRGEHCNCAQCGVLFYRRPCEARRRFCSRGCANLNKTKHQKSERCCPTCKQVFMAPDRPHSNSSGRYCSFKCRNEGYIGSYRGKPAYGCPGHRRGWKAIRNRHIQDNNDFCIRCGRVTGGRLQVHHIEPYRLSRNNQQGNLVTVCSTCHPKLERISERIAGLSPELRPVAVALVAADLEDRWAAIQGHRLLAGVVS